MRRTVGNTAVRSGFPTLAVCLAAALVCIAPPAAAQLAYDAEAVRSFLGDRALEIHVQDDGDSVLDLARSELTGAGLAEACVARWDEMIEEDRIDCLRPRMRPWLAIVEQIPDLGTLWISPDFHTLEPSWSVEQDGDRLVVRERSGRRGEILFFDGSRLTLRFRGGGEPDERWFLSAPAKPWPMARMPEVAACSTPSTPCVSDATRSAWISSPKMSSTNSSSCTRPTCRSGLLPTSTTTLLRGMDRLPQPQKSIQK
jgi:hypothetical protein